MTEKKQRTPENKSMALDIALGLEAYGAEMAPLTRNEAEKFQKANLSIFSEEDLKLL